MKQKKIMLMSSLIFILFAMLFGDENIFPFFVPIVFAHCDSLDGPVIKDAQKALETKNIDLVLIWVQKKDEKEIKKAFERALEVRKLSPEAKALADMHFYETLVRIHRAGEGAPYTGLKPAGTEMDPGIVAADKAVESGNIDSLAKQVSSKIEHTIRERFDTMMEKKKRVSDSVEAGREFVEAYVTFIHYIESLHTLASGHGIDHGASERIRGEHSTH